MVSNEGFRKENCEMRGLVADVIVGIIAIEAIRIYGKIKYEQGKMDATKAIVVEVKKED